MSVLVLIYVSFGQLVIGTLLGFVLGRTMLIRGSLTVKMSSAKAGEDDSLDTGGTSNAIAPNSLATRGTNHEDQGGGH